MEAVTKAAQQEELERRKRLEQQRKDYAAPIPTVPFEFLPGEQCGRSGRSGRGGQGQTWSPVVISGSLSSQSALGALEQRDLIHKVQVAERVLLTLILFKFRPLPPLTLVLNMSKDWDLF